MDEVTILPWIHNIEQGSHRDIINLLQGLPRGARLYIEVDDKGKRWWQKILDSKVSTVIASIGGNSNQLALLELLSTAARHNHQVTALEGVHYWAAHREVGAMRSEFKKPTQSTGQSLVLIQKVMKTFSRREATFASRIEAGLFREKRTIFVICGLRHAEQLNRLLRKRRIGSRVATQFFRHPEHIKKLIEINTKLDAAIQRGDAKEIRQLNTQLSLTTDKDKETRSWKPRIRIILQHLRWLKNRRIRAARNYGTRMRRARKLMRHAS